MIFQLLPDEFASIGAFVGILFAFLTTIIATDKLCAYLPKDAGREFANVHQNTVYNSQDMEET